MTARMLRPLIVLGAGLALQLVTLGLNMHALHRAEAIRREVFREVSARCETLQRASWVS